ncbi:ABC transporter permease [Flavitalea sp. BT771]|uniref:ABC transporter permease n=1 Tax=Flavitalea sp. BT771 TaxID=3063329 RepID=UPI0026E23DAE|nr:ABC transporter permease [Flavitalea sp. BT771]MDO6434841.1 ABC transporter permease [Flavitalea sp. BT771]MDV6223741.1 ABC transporter permease [Flavitalea sp. BT771]
MVQHFFKMALRVLSRNKIFAFINILGLAMGIAACIVIYQVCSYELSFDRDHPAGDRIYRLGGRVEEDRGQGTLDVAYTEDTPPPVAHALQEEISGIEAVASYYRYPARGHDGTIITAPGYFSIFKYDWLAGNPVTALEDPFSVVLSERKARKYFGGLAFNDILGKELIYDDSIRVRVTGVVKDWQENTDIPYTEFISISTIGRSGLKNSYQPDNWHFARGNPWARAFVKLAKDRVRAGVEEQLPGFAARHLRTDSMLRLVKFGLVLQPLSDMHFNAAYDHDGIRKADLPMLYVLIGVAMFILLMAVVNFVNLSTAQSIQRAKETGVRKVLGGSRSGLVRQFLVETFLLTFLATAVAISMVFPLLSLFRDYIPAGVTFSLFSVDTLVFVGSMMVVTTLLAGVYPARILSSYLPVKSLKGAVDEKGSYRGILTCFQFVLSLVFIIGVLGVRNQIEYMLDTSPGFTKDAVITMNAWNGSEEVKLFRQRVKQLPGVEDCILQGHAPMGAAIIEVPMKIEGQTGGDMLVSLLAGGRDLVPFYRLKLLAGRNMLESDSLHELVINETYRRALGFSSDAAVIGRMIRIQGKVYPIVGVVADFHTGSFHEAIRSLAIGHVPELENSVGIRLGAGGGRDALARIGQVWKQLFPREAFSFTWLDESIAQLYAKDRQTQRLITVAMVVAVMIACMGVLGLVLFTTERRTKEISIRKVLGAGFSDVAWMLSRHLFVLLGIALLIASPLAWLGLRRWLRGFAYRTGVSWTLFAGAGLAALFIVACTVGLQVIKAATRNPSRGLRTE